MDVRPTTLDGVVELEPRRFGDERGWFSESWNAKTLADVGLDLVWVQDNESLSTEAGTIRGIHFQVAPFAQDKLVRAIAGRVFDVAVDLRPASPTFGEWAGVELDASRGNQLLVPVGFGHAFCTLTPDCRVAYKVTAHYSPDHERSVIWNDPTVAIDWPPQAEDAALSAKDAAAPHLADLPADSLF